MVFALAVVAAFIVASGEVLQQRLAAQAPPEDNLSPRLLLWLVQRPRWLAGVGCSLAGNLVFAGALTMGSVILVEAVFVSRLIFGLVIAALWGWHRVPVQDLLGALVITAGLAAFVLAARTQPGSGEVPVVRWCVGAGSLVALAVALAVVARRLAFARRALLLGAGAGILFGLQASLVRSAVAILTGQGLLSLLRSWHGYSVVAVALLGMFLVQSAFESAPLAASYPAVVNMQLFSAIAVGVWVLGGSIALSPPRLAVIVASLLAMVAGIFVLARSPLVTGQHHRLAGPGPPPGGRDGGHE
ncbi:MAG: DMT family transporter [Nocardioidaceae bacterium]